MTKTLMYTKGMPTKVIPTKVIPTKVFPKRGGAPGMVSIKNVIIFVLVGLLFLISYLYLTGTGQNSYGKNGYGSNSYGYAQPTSIFIQPSPNLIDAATPPLQRPDSYMLPYLGATGTGPSVPEALQIAASGKGVPINIHTSSKPPSSYDQVGILTKGDTILPLYGRQIGRDKKQYYTLTNTSGIQTKLPVSVNGKSCTGEYGCDEVFNNDNFFVEGYKDTFAATIYEKGENRYIPYI